MIRLSIVHKYCEGKVKRVLGKNSEKDPEMEYVKSVG